MGKLMEQRLLNSNPTVEELADLLSNNQSKYGRSACLEEAKKLLEYDDGDQIVLMAWDGSGGVSCSIVEGFGEEEVVCISHLFGGSLNGKVYVDAVSKWAKSKGINRIILTTTFGSSKSQMKVLQNLGFEVIGFCGEKNL